MTPCRLLGAALMLTCCATASMAGRPLSTEDAGVNPPRQCQLEAWSDKGSNTRSNSLAPACGVADGLELGLQFDRPMPRATTSETRAMALKWAPDFMEWQGWRFGAKLATGQERDPSDWRWRSSTWSALGITSKELAEQLFLHANLGYAKNQLDEQSSTTYSVALSWTPLNRLQLFTEVVGDNRSPGMPAAGARWWLIPEVLGLDTIVSRTNTVRDSTVWHIGFGWYGIRF
ncbi:MAG: hypothetical protein V4532_16435 [Pseudomonadota bacterium]